jgi:hypothetical protein
MMAEPTMAPADNMDAPDMPVQPPAEVAPDANGAVVPGDGANYGRRAPMVDPNAFLIGNRGYGN